MVRVGEVGEDAAASYPLVATGHGLGLPGDLASVAEAADLAAGTCMARSRSWSVRDDPHAAVC